MKIVIGSENKDKIKIVYNAFDDLHLSVQVEGVKADSKITDQPLTKDITRQGAINRARGARVLSPEADFWIGLEGGLHDYGDGYHLVTFACLLDADANEYVDEGEEIHLPEEVSKQVKNGAWFGDVIREYAKAHEIDQNLITRVAPFTRAIQSAYVEYLKSTAHLKFRQRASAVVVDQDEHFLIVQLHSYGENDWNFSGGGLEEGEKPEEAVLRELTEELGTQNFKILKKSQYKEVYDWPNWLIAGDIRNKKPTIYRGQEATFFLVSFLGKKEEIQPDTKELRKIKWVTYDEIQKHFNFDRQKGLLIKINDLRD